MKRLFIFVLALTVLTPRVARADDASKQKKIVELFALTRIEESVQLQRESMIAHARKLVTTIATDTGFSELEKQHTKNFLDAVVELAAHEYDWATVKPEFIKLYMSVYTEDELDGILTFYHSRAGQAILNKIPALNEGRLKIMQDRDAASDVAFRALYTSYLKQLQQDAEQDSAKPQH